MNGEGSVWVRDKSHEVYLHKKFLERGFFVVKTSVTSASPTHQSLPVDPNSFVVRDRTLAVVPEGGKLEKLIRNKNLNPVLELAGILEQASKKAGQQAIRKLPDTKAIYNRTRRGEIYLPFSITVGSDVDTVHAHLWSSDSKTKELNLSTYISAACLIGAGLRAIDQSGGSIQLIKHDHKFFPGQCIESVYVDTSVPNCYEETLFKQMGTFKQFVKGSMHTNEASIFLHLPDIDYLLFGLNLVIEKRMTLTAYGMFIYHVYSARNRYKERINKAFTDDASVKIKVVFSSPFSSLLDLDDVAISKIYNEISGMDSQTKSQDEKFKELAEEVVHRLDVWKLPPKPMASEQEGGTVTDYVFDIASLFQCMSDFKLLVSFVNQVFKFIGEILKRLNLILTALGAVASPTQRFSECLIRKLMKVNSDPVYGQTWNDFFERKMTLNISKIGSLEDVFKIANAVFVGAHSKNKSSADVCVFQTVVEKPIQISYQKIRNRQEESQYPSVLNVTVLDRVMPYGMSANASIFNLGVGGAHLVPLLQNCLTSVSKFSLKSTEEVDKDIRRDFTPSR